MWRCALCSLLLGFILGVLQSQVLYLSFCMHFELIFVSGVRYRSSFIVLSVAIQVSQHHSLKMSILNSLAKTDHVCVGLYLGSHSVPLVSVSVFIMHPPQFSWSELLVQMLQASILDEITVWFRVVVWPQTKFLFEMPFLHVSWPH